MPLEASDLKLMYEQVYKGMNRGMLLETVEIFRVMEELGYDPVSFKKEIDTAIKSIEAKQSSMANWRDVRLEKALPQLRALATVLFCPLKEVPKHLYDQYFSEIANWRLQNAI